MAQRIINNTFAITAYIGSKTYVNTLVVDNGKLHQFYDKDNGGKCNPDWETSTADQPKFHFECRTTDGTLQNLQKDTVKLYYNETEIPFSSSTKLSTGTFAGMFKYEDVDEVRYFTICKNVATVGNMDNDTLRISGDILTDGNNLETVSTPTITIHVIPVASGGSAYFMEIEAPAILNGKTSTTLTAMVYKSDGTGEITSGVTYKWERLDGENYTQVGTSKTLVVPAEDVNGFEHYRCVATIGSVTVVAACSVFDYNDGIFIEVAVTGIGNPTSMRNGETAKVTASVVDKDGNPKIDYTGTLTFTLLNKTGEKVKSSTANPQTFTYTEIINAYGGTVTGYVTLE